LRQSPRPCRLTGLTGAEAGTMDITGRNQRERDHSGSSGTDAHAVLSPCQEAQNDKPADPVRVPSHARFCATGTLVGVSES
jgi:hypothetical protein